MYFFVDAETDGLYGGVIAIGAAVYDGHWKEVDHFFGMVDLKHASVTDEWVKENVIPVLQGETSRCYASEDQLLDAFWEFWLKHRENSLCIADVAYPVETGLFRKCVLKNERERRFLGPYPLLDLSTALYVRGYNPLVNRIELSGESDLKRHHPLDDARLAARLWRMISDAR